jgi:hypothetical protein
MSTVRRDAQMQIAARHDLQFTARRVSAISLKPTGSNSADIMLCKHEARLQTRSRLTPAGPADPGQSQQQDLRRTTRQARLRELRGSVFKFQAGRFNE